IASTFSKSRGTEVGDSLVEDDFLATAREISQEAQKRGAEIVLPTDVVITQAFAADAASRTVPAGDGPAGWRILDAGPETVEAFAAALAGCGTVFWNGTLGVAEFPAFAKGSLALAEKLTEVKATVVVGGGETAALVEQAGLRD